MQEELVLPEIISAPVWRGFQPNRFPSNKRHAPEPLVLNPEGHFPERRHYQTLPLSPTIEFKPSVRMVDPIDHLNDREVGTTKVIKHFVLVKPKIDRVPKINPRLPPKEPVTLADMLPGKMFLQKY